MPSSCWRLIRDHPVGEELHCRITLFAIVIGWRGSLGDHQRLALWLQEELVMSCGRQRLAGRRSGSDSAAHPKLRQAEKVLLGELHLRGGDGIPCRDDVEPFLAALFQVEHLNLLVGSGLTSALASRVGFTETADMNARLPVDDDNLTRAIEDAAMESAKRSGRGKPNIEDRLRVAIEAVDGLHHLDDDRAPLIREAVETAIGRLRDAIWRTEAALKTGPDPEHEAADSMSVQGLLMSFLGSFAGRVPTRDRLHLFTTNYDRVLEWGADLAGLRIVDRFVGSLRPVFRSSRVELDYYYSPPGAVRDPRYLHGVFRLTKLHGSLDWRSDAERRRVVRVALPFGHEPESKADDLLIYPQASKDIETTFYPYGDLFRDFSGALCRPHSALVTYGYGFGDDHINRIIADMLTIPSTFLLIINYDEKSERVTQFVKDRRHSGQVGLLLGEAMADLGTLVDEWLPRPSAEFLLQGRAQISRDRSIATGTSGTHDDESTER